MPTPKTLDLTPQEALELPTALALPPQIIPEAGRRKKAREVAASTFDAPQSPNWRFKFVEISADVGRVKDVASMIRDKPSRFEIAWGNQVAGAGRI